MASLMAFLILSLLPQAQIEESLRAHYETGRWEKFFAYALTYRLTVEEKNKTDVQLLEPLALLRHCQSEALKNVASEISNKAPKYETTLHQILSLSRTKFKGKAAEDRSSKASPFLAHFQGRSFSKVSAKKIQELDPEKLIVKVENLCD